MNKEYGFPFVLEPFEGKVSVTSLVPEDFNLPIDLYQVVEEAWRVIRRFSLEVLSENCGKAVFGSTCLTEDSPDKRALKVISARRVIKNLCVSFDPLEYYDGADGRRAINPLIACDPLPYFGRCHPLDPVAALITKEKVVDAVITITNDIARSLVIAYFGFSERKDALECDVPEIRKLNQVVELHQTGASEVFLGEFFQRPDSSVQTQKERFLREVLVYIPRRMQYAGVMTGALKFKNQPLIDPVSDLKTQLGIR